MRAPRVRRRACPRRSASENSQHVRSTSGAVKALVEATPISGPVCMEMYPSARAMACEPMAFTMDHSTAPLRRASPWRPGIDSLAGLADGQDHVSLIHEWGRL